MKNIILYLNLKELLFNPRFQTFWIALGSTGTFLMAIFTYRLIKYYEKIEKKKVVREIIEKVIVPLVSNLKNILVNLQELSLSSSYLNVTGGGVWEWQKIKEKYPFLIYSPLFPEWLKNKIEKFQRELNKFIALHNRCLYLLDQSIFECLEELILNELKKSTGRRSLTGGPRRAYYEINIGGNTYRITFHRLLFHNKTLDEYIEFLKENISLPSRDVVEEKFICDGVTTSLSKNKFIEIYSIISQKVYSDSKLREFIEKCRNFYEYTEDLKAEFVKFSKMDPKFY